MSVMYARFPAYVLTVTIHVDVRLVVCSTSLYITYHMWLCRDRATKVAAENIIHTRPANDHVHRALQHDQYMVSIKYTVMYFCDTVLDFDWLPQVDFG
jgi:hypothetical protein